MPNLETMDILEITESDLLNLIGRSENQCFEFKSQKIEGYKFAKVVCGFANAKGGYIVIGANEDQHGVCDGFVSVSRPGVLHQQVQQFVRDYIDEPVQGIETKDIKLPSGENLLLVHIPESTRKPHAIRRQGERLLQFWIRSGSHNVEMKLNEIRNCFLESAGVLDILAGSESTQDGVDRLSDLEKEILVQAVDDNGELYLLSANEIGNWLRVGRKDFQDDENPAVRVEAIDALEHLESLDLVRHVEDAYHTLTGKGIRAAQEVKEKQG